MIEEPSDDFYSDDFYRAYAALHHPDDPKPKEDRNAVEAMLQRVSEGEKDNEALLFMKELARCILAAGGKGSPAARRADRVLNATGMAGKYAHNQSFAEAATVMLGFDGYTKASATNAAGFYDDDVFAKRKQIDSFLKRQSHVTPEKAWSSTST